MRTFFIIYTFLHSSFLFSQVAWTVKQSKGIVQALDVEDTRKELILLKEGSTCLETYMVSVEGDKDALLVLEGKKNKEDKHGITVSIEAGSMIGLGRYKEIASDLILIKGSARITITDIKSTISIETSSLKFVLGKNTDVKIDSVPKESSYETSLCVATGTFDIKDIDNNLISKINKGQKQVYWKKRKNTQKTCELISLIEKPKPIVKKQIVKKPEPKPVKKINEEDTFTVGGIEQELFNEIQSDDELEQELMKVFKEKDVEVLKCSDCEKKWGKLIFNVPEGINYISSDLYTDKTLPAVFFNMENGELTNTVFSGYKQAQATPDAKFAYLLPVGKYFVTIIKGPAFMVEVKSQKTNIYNVSAFISAGINAEIIIPETNKTQSLIPSKTAPMFVYPGKYNFNLAKQHKDDTDKKIELTIKPGAIMIVKDKK